MGDNLGYWIARKYGPEAIERYGHWVLVTPKRLGAARRFVTRYGAAGVFAARFLTGLRFLAGPLAGAMGLRPSRFLVANLLGVVVFVPLAVGAGYAVGYGLGSSVEQVQRAASQVENIVLAATVLGSIALLGWWALGVRQHHRRV